MAEYLIILLVYIIGYVKYGTERSYRSNLFYIFECILLILLWGLRYRVGGDSIRYESYFEFLPTIENIETYDYKNSSFQPFWLYYNVFIKLICDDFRFFQIVHSLTINSLLFLFISKNCKNRFLSILIYYILYSSYFSTEILREILSVITFLYASQFLLKRRYVTYFLIAFIAVMFHVSALFLFILPLLLLCYSNEHPVRSLIIWSFTFFILSSFLLKIIPYDIMSSLLSSSYNEYLDNIVSGKSLFNFNGILLNLIQQTVVFVPTIILIKQKNKDLSQILFIYCLVSIMGVQFFFISRLYNYFYIFLIIAYSDLFLKMRKNKLAAKTSFFLKLTFVLLFFFRFTFYNRSKGFIVGSMYNRYYPYYSILAPQKDPIREKMIEFEWIY